jgi:hypothetical protein
VGHRSPNTPLADSLAGGSTGHRAFGAQPEKASSAGPLPAFRYLTGFLEPDAALVIVARNGCAG